MTLRSGTSLRVAITVVLALGAGAAGSWRLFAQAPEPSKGVKYAQISPVDMKEWLTYLSSDELQGRQVFTEGYGVASQYIADHLKDWGVKPMGDDGTYFEIVKLKGYQVERKSTVTIETNGTTKTFKFPEHVTFGANSGGNQSLTFSSVEFVGYGQDADFQGRNVKDKLVVWVPNLAPPAGGAPAAGRGGRGGRGGNASVAAVNTYGAKAVGQFVPAPAPPSAAETALAQAQDALAKATQAVQEAQASLGRGGRGGGVGAGGAGGGRGRAALPPADLTGVTKVDNIVPPQFSGDETFFEALFAGGPVKFADILAKAQKGEPIPPMTLTAKVTVNVDNTFEGRLRAAQPQRRRHDRRHGPEAEGHLRDVRRAPRPHRVQPDRRRQPAEPERMPAAQPGRAQALAAAGKTAQKSLGGGRGAAAAPGAGRGAQPTVNRDALRSARLHQQRRGR